MSNQNYSESDLNLLVTSNPASGSLNATLDAPHPTFNSTKVFFRMTSFNQVEISAVDNDRHWVFNFDKNITPNTYLIADQAIKRIWYTQKNPDQPGHSNVFTPAPFIGKIIISEFDLTKGIFKAEFEFSIWRRSEGNSSIANAKGAIDAWDMEAN